MDKMALKASLAKAMDNFVIAQGRALELETKEMVECQEFGIFASMQFDGEEISVSGDDHVVYSRPAAAFRVEEAADALAEALAAAYRDASASLAGVIQEMLEEEDV
jgi:hypothetical protein